MTNKIIKFLKPDGRKISLFVLLLLGFFVWNYLSTFQRCKSLEYGPFNSRTLCSVGVILGFICVGPLYYTPFAIKLIYEPLVSPMKNILSTFFIPFLIIYWWVLSCAVVESSDKIYDKIKRNKAKRIAKK